jgi:hypothetical protein
VRPMRPPAPATISRMSAMCLSLRAGIAEAVGRAKERSDVPA